MAGALVAALKPLRAQAAQVRYSAAVRPPRALLGERVIGVFGVTAQQPADVLTFEDPSLTMELRSLESPGHSSSTFPNHTAVERGSVIERRSPTRESRRLRPGEHIERSFDLVETFPEIALTPGDLELAFQIGEDGNVTRGARARLVVESGPDAVANLFGLLGHQHDAVRASASTRLHQMTAYAAGYDPDGDAGTRQVAIARWQAWWQAIGRGLPWSFATRGAVLHDAPVGPVPRQKRSKFLGGIRYQRTRLSPASTKALAGVLAAWTRDPAAGIATLAGKTWVGDRLFTYPLETSLVDPGEEAAVALESALARLARLAAADGGVRPEAALLLGTVARMPEARFASALSAVQGGARGKIAWRDTVTVATELLEISAPPQDGG